MSKLLITPVESSGVEPYIVEGQLYKGMFEGKLYWYCNNESYPDEIVTRLED